MLFRAPRVAAGAFRCPVEHPAFPDSGPIQEFIVVFPRTSLWIQHDGSRAFVADPNVVTIYNASQRYQRFPLSPDGDRCDWFAVSDGLAREVVSAYDPAAASSDRPFRFEWARSTAPLYLRQRTLIRRAERGEADALEMEEQVIEIVAAVCALAYRRPPGALARRAAAVRRQRDLAEAARAELFRTSHANRSVHDVARTLGTSPFHLCRVFRACTGQTMHEYRTELRVRLALEWLEATRACSANIAAVAHGVGFASHAHFVRATRRHLASTPSDVRRALGCP